MALASLEEINEQLPEDKAQVAEAKYDPFQLDAERIVRGTLAGVLPRATLATWLDPDSTPQLIRAIVARLVAAFAYRKLYSEDSLEDPTFAQNKYNEAMSFLQQIVDGKMQFEEMDTAIVQGHFASGDFYPDTRAAGPYFRRGQEL